MSASVTLAVIFNHRYDANFERLENMYTGRFDNLVHIVPFYDGDKGNVIRVFENSHRFHGYIAQAVDHLLEFGSDYYVFAADDLVLNPVLCSKTILKLLGIPPGYSYIPFRPFMKSMGYWSHTQSATFIKRNASGAEGWNYLPDAKEAEVLLTRHGVRLIPAVASRTVYSKPSLSTVLRERSLRAMLHHTKLTLRYLLNRDIPLDYPFVWGYSDFCVVPRETLSKFAYYCGVFAAMNLFVEIALPTSILFSTDKVISSLPPELSGWEIWSEKELVALKQRYDNSLPKLLLKFPEGKAYIHPIKFSQWTE